MPKWRGAMFIESGSESPDDPLFTFFGNQGGRAVRINVPGAVRIRLRDALLDSQGRIFFAADFWKGSGERASSIGRVDSAGNVLMLRQTNPFQVFKITTDSRGRIWAFGQNIIGNVEQGLATDHPVFQVFGAEGGTATGFVMASTISRQRLIPVAYSSSMGDTHLLSSKDKIGLYVAMLTQWTEVSLDGQVLWQSTIALPTVSFNGESFTLAPQGLALTESNRLFGYFMNARVPAYRGLGYYELDRDHRVWRPMTSMNSGKHSMLWGAEGDDLIVSTSGTAGFKQYLRVSPPPAVSP